MGRVVAGTVREIFRYPVKSMMGESLESVEIGSGGLPGDRCWAVRDEVNGGIRGAKRIAGLMALGARFPREPATTGSSPAEIHFPDGSTGMTGDSDIAARISQAVDHEVTLWPLLPAEELDHYRRGRARYEDIDKELRAVFAREPGEPLPDVSTFPPELREFESRPGTYFDAYPLLVLTTAALDEMQRRAPEQLFDVRRFRPNLVLEVEGPTEPFSELAWAGHSLRLGEAELELELGCPRCVMVTRGFDDLPQDPRVMRALVSETGGELGIYASVAVPGGVRRGARFEVHESG